MGKKKDDTPGLDELAHKDIALHEMKGKFEQVHQEMKDDQEMAEFMVDASEQDVLIAGGTRADRNLRDVNHGKGGDPEAELKRNDRAFVRAQLAQRKNDSTPGLDELAHKDIALHEMKGKFEQVHQEMKDDQEMAEFMVDASEQDVLIAGGTRADRNLRDVNHGKGGDPEAERKRNDRAAVKAALEDRGRTIPADTSHVTGQQVKKPRVKVVDTATPHVTEVRKGTTAAPSPTSVADRSGSIGFGKS